MNGGTENTEEGTPRLRIGITNFERRRHPRFSVDLPLEYYRTEAPAVRTGRAINASEGGFLIYFPERMEIGQHLRIKLYFTFGSELNMTECLVEIVWVDLNMGEGWGDYRAGAKFIDISQEDLGKVKRFLRSLAEP
jgi:c-di-GMP-binding flagellar brake protein YcgR